jgi:sulfur relay (sulfurtransferase) DsrF/TusC family protein
MVSEEEEVVAEEEESISGPVSMESAEEEVEEETIKEEAVEEEMIEGEQTEVVEETHEEEKEEKVVEKEEAKEKKSTSKTTKKSTVQTKKTAKQKKIQQEKAIVKNIDRIMDKVDSDIKDMAKNLQIKNIIKLNAMASEQASLDLYRNAVFYKPKNIYLDQLQIQDLRQLYTNVNLSTYTLNDPVFIKNKKLKEINLKKQKLLIELEQLKNG